MAPRTSAPARRKTMNNETVFSLGVQGRKTGVVLHDDGARDEHGFQPLEGIFDSSPGKPSNAGDTSEVDMSMDIENTPGPDPRALLNNQSMRRPIPRAMSPPWPSLKSPPRKPGASPLRPSAVAPNGSFMPPKPIARKLDFSSTHTLPRPASSHSTLKAMGRQSSLVEQDESEVVEEEAEDTTEVADDDAAADDSMQMIDVGGDDEPDLGIAADENDSSVQSEPEEEPAPVVRSKRASAKNAAPQKRGRKRRSVGSDPPLEDAAPEKVVEEQASSAPEDNEDDEEDAPVQPAPRRGRPAKGKAKEAAAPAPNPAKRRRGARRSLDDAPTDEPEPEPEAEAEEPAPKRSRVGSKGAPGRKSAAPVVEEEGEPSDAKPKGRRGHPPAAAVAKRALSVAAVDPDESVAVVPRPPMPKRRGLVISRKEKINTNPFDIIKTRSGRSSIRPLKFWRQEHVELDSTAGLMDDALLRGKHLIRLPSIKEIHRVESPPPDLKPSHSRRGGGKKPGRRRAAAAADYSDDDDDDEDVESWERDPGYIVGPVAVWGPEQELNPPGVDDEIEVMDDTLAFAGSAIKSKEVLNASFRFTKLMTLPFFGTGVVDLPPWAEKKAKNSRKMFMAFMVFTGRVRVMVNDRTFSIGKGGTWFVPRGNYYSIVNDSWRHARIFFSQACEIIAQPEEEEAADEEPKEEEVDEEDED